jgi:hypothetical protein
MITNLKDWKRERGDRRLVGYNQAGSRVIHAPAEGVWFVEPDDSDESWIERSFSAAINSWHGQPDAQ